MTAVDELLVLQEIDTAIRDIERELQDIPKRQERERARLNEHRQEVAACEESIKATQARLMEIELEVSTRRERIGKFRQQQFLIKTNKEFKAIESEISGVEAEISRIEDRQLAMMEEADQMHQTLAEKRHALSEEETSVARDVAVWDERADLLRSQLEEHKGKRRIAAEPVDAEWLVEYERIFSRRSKAVVPLEEGFCGGCHMQQPPYVQHDARKRLTMVKCSECGRLLY